MLKIFLVEDEMIMREGIKKNIDWEKENFSFVGDAADGELAYPLIIQKKPDILITDIKMPFMDGLELSRLVKAELPDIKIIVLSGYDEFDYAKEAIDIGIAEYLLKPVDPEELTLALGNIRKQYQIEQKAYEDIFNESMTRNSPEQIAATLRDYLVQNYNMDINLNLIAGSMHYSPSYLTRIFQQQYQMSPLKFITQMRLSQAKHYLSHNPELSVKQVSEMIGYQDQGYFSRLFKKNTGVSPLDWRNQD